MKQFDAFFVENIFLKKKTRIYCTLIQPNLERKQWKDN